MKKKENEKQLLNRVLCTSFKNINFAKTFSQLKTQGAEEPDSTFINIKMFDQFRSACDMLSDFLVYATVKPAAILCAWRSRRLNDRGRHKIVTQ